jgi:hypothetical protein
MSASLTYLLLLLLRQVLQMLIQLAGTAASLHGVRVSGVAAGRRRP